MVLGRFVPGYRLSTKAICFTTIWSPEAGYNPVVQFSSDEQPDGKLGDKTEWQWKVFNDTYVQQLQANRLSW